MHAQFSRDKFGWESPKRSLITNKKQPEPQKDQLTTQEGEVSGWAHGTPFCGTRDPLIER